MVDFFNTYQQEIINTVIVFGALFIFQFIANLMVRKLGRSRHKKRLGLNSLDVMCLLRFF